MELLGVYVIICFLFFKEKDLIEGGGRVFILSFPFFSWKEGKKLDGYIKKGDKIGVSC